MYVAVARPETFGFSEPAAATLDSLARSTHASDRSAVLRDSLSLFRSCVEHWTAGRRVAVHSPGAKDLLFIDPDQIRADAIRSRDKTPGEVVSTFEFSTEAVAALDDLVTRARYPDQATVVCAALSLYAAYVQNVKVHHKVFVIVDGDAIFCEIRMPFLTK